MNGDFVDASVKACEKSLKNVPATLVIEVGESSKIPWEKIDSAFTRTGELTYRVTLILFTVLLFFLPSITGVLLIGWPPSGVTPTGSWVLPVGCAMMQLAILLFVFVDKANCKAIKLKKKKKILAFLEENDLNSLMWQDRQKDRDFRKKRLKFYEAAGVFPYPKSRDGDIVKILKDVGIKIRKE